MSEVFRVRLSGLIALVDRGDTVAAISISPEDHNTSLVFPLRQMRQLSNQPRHRVIEDPNTGVVLGVVELDGARADFRPDGERVSQPDHTLNASDVCGIDAVLNQQIQLDPAVLDDPLDSRVNSLLALETGSTAVDPADLGHSDEIAFVPDPGNISPVRFSESILHQFETDAEFVDVVIRRMGDSRILRLVLGSTATGNTTIAIGNHPEGHGHGGHHFLKYYGLAQSTAAGELPMPNLVQSGGPAAFKTGSSGCIPAVVAS